MESIRGRLTIWYATALILSIGVFAVVLYFARRSATYQDLDRRIQSEADLTAGILAESFRARGVLVQKDTAARPVLIPEVAAVLEVVPDYLLVTSKDGSLLFGSPDARSLGFARFEQVLALARAAATAEGVAGPGRYHVPDGPTIHYVIRSVPEAGGQIGTILAGADTRSAALQVDQLITTIVIAFLVGIVPAVLVGRWIAGRALEPVDSMITEIREITDGRSLHRRLAIPMEKDELGRLAATLNQMWTRLERSFVALRRFTADASHELKTPLTVVRAGGAASRARLRRAGALQARREPRAQDTADRRPRGGGARDHAARPAARDARPARGDAPGGEPDDGAARRAVDAGTRGRGTRGTAQGAGRLAGDH